MENANSKALFNAIDYFFSYGYVIYSYVHSRSLFAGNRLYWRFIREFLPSAEQAMLRAEWGAMDERRLSIAWLKNAFNKATLHFQMLSFATNR